MKRTPAEVVVEFLSFSSDPGDRLNEVQKFSQREWGGVIRWLDDSGIAFYFVQKLKETNATPPAC